MHIRVGKQFIYSKYGISSNSVDKLIQSKDLFLKDDKLNEKCLQVISSTINEYLPKVHHISSVELDKILVNFTPKDGAFTIKYFKKTNVTKRTLIHYTDNMENHVLLIKSPVKNEIQIHGKNYPSQNVCKGSYKFIKTTAVKLVLNKQLDIIDIKRVVTCSKNTFGNKDKYLEEINGAELIKEGFEKVNFSNHNNKSRIIYVNDYLGKHLVDLKNLLDNERVLKITEAILASLDKIIDLKINDIKLENILFDIEKEILSFIDYSQKIFTFTTIRSKYKGDYLNKDDSKEMLKQRILGLTYLFYLLFNKTPSYIQLHYDEIKSDLKISEKNAKHFLINELIKAYNEELTIHELKEGVLKAIDANKKLNKL